jgi:iron complex transport system permease protein
MVISNNITYNGSNLLIKFIILLFLFFIFVAFDLVFGSVKIPFNELMKTLFSFGNETSDWSTIIFDFRIPKLVTAILAGAALSVSGLQMQTIFRNPLAGPYVLGISAGASLGVAIMVIGFSGLFTSFYVNNYSNWSLVIAACIGSGMVLMLVFAVSTRVKDILTLLILGMMFGSAISALVSILQYFGNEGLLKSFLIWTMGSLGGVTKPQLEVLCPVIVVGLVISIASVKILNALLIGETYAKSMGLNIKQARFLVFFSTSLLAGSITAFCGPIGFIGIAVPHVTRYYFKTANHGILMWGVILIGSILMMFSDIVSQLPGQQVVLPITSVTALLGIPIVVWVIIKNQRLA